MSRAEDVLMRLYEDADLRDELTDEEADRLLKWAETELSRLDASAADDAAFETQADTLMKLLKHMNRFAGRQGQLSAQGASQTPDTIATLASELGHPSDAAKVAAAATGDPATTLEALTALISAQTDQAAVSAAAPAVPDPTTKTTSNALPPRTDMPDSGTPASGAPPRGAQTYTWERNNTNADLEPIDPNEA